MSAKKDPMERVYPLNGTVQWVTQAKVKAQAVREGVTVARIVGRVMDEYAEGLPGVEPDPNQMKLEGV